MSTLNVATIKSISSAAPVFQNTSGTEKGQLAKAWLNFNGTGTVAINDSFNISSITDNGTGDYTLNFSNNMANANYVVCGSTVGTTVNYFNGIFGSSDSFLSASQVRFRTASTTNPNTAQDSQKNHILIHGDN